jgi:hypothetical protein
MRFHEARTVASPGFGWPRTRGVCAL